MSYLRSHKITQAVFTNSNLSIVRCAVVTKAFILIETAVGKSRDVSGALQSLEGIVSVDMVTGPYDIVAVLEAPDLNSIGGMVTGRVHTIVGVQRTVTCLSMGS